MISVDIDPAQVAEVRERLDYLANGANRALSRALNKTASKAKTAASKAIRAQVLLTAAYVRENLNGPAQGWAYKATVNKLEARLSAPKRGIRLERFLVSPPPTRPGKPASGEEPRVKVKPQRAAITIWSGWWVRARNSGGYLIAVSNDVLAKLNMKKQISGAGKKYSVLYGPSLSQVYAGVKDQVGTDMTPVLAANLKHEMEWLLQKYPPPTDDGSAEEP